MKKILLTLFLGSCILNIGNTSFAAGNFAQRDCGLYTNSSGCGTCFEGPAIYEGYTQTGLYDNYTNGTGGQRVLWRNRYGGIQGNELNAPTTEWGWTQTDMWQHPTAFGFYTQPSTGQQYHVFGTGTERFVETKPGMGVGLISVNHATASRTVPSYRLMFTIKTQPLSTADYNNTSLDTTLTECVFFYPAFCGDGIKDSDKNEQCDDGNSNSGDGCSNTCQTEVTPVCNNLTVTPTSVTNGGTVTYTCSGTNVTSYSIIAKKPDGTTFSSSTSAAGSIILPASPAGAYTVSCYVNGQVSTPSTCQKTVTNTVVNEPVCTGLTVTPTSVTNGGNVTYTCTGDNVTSYSVILKKPDGTTIQSLTSATGTLTVPASPSGVYTASCYVNGQTTTPTVCQKTVTNTVINEAVCTDLSVTPTSLINGGNVTYTCSGNNVSSYSVVFTKPDGTVFQSLTTASGSVTVPASPTGSYTAKCYVNGQTTTPAACQKTVSNNESICTGLTITPASLVNGGNVSYSCTGNNVSSYSVIFKKPDGTTLQSFSTASGSVTVPSTPLGTYTAQCYVNGQTTTPAECTKTVSNNTVITPTCDNLSVTTSGTTINYSCSGSNVSSYSIFQNGSQISTNASGSINAGYGTHTLICYVNNSITSASCQKTVTINNPTYPQIQVVKDDNDNHDDSQFLQTGGAAQFTIVVRNPGSEPLENVILTDIYAPECNRGAYDTQNMISLVGNRDYRLDPGESFSYLCTRTNVNQSTFPNNENRVCVEGRGTPSGIAVNSCDTTRVEFAAPVSICQNIQVSQNGTQTNVYCAPSGGYKLFVLQGTQVINTLQSPNGQFTFDLNDGTYKVVCLKDGEIAVQPNCQKTITINPKQNYCVLESTVQYGGAPLRTQLNCSSPIYAQCMIRIMKDGKPWRSVANCHADMIFEERGVYDATCIIGDAETQSCSARVQVDIMTIIRTGPFLPILVVLAIGMAGYITYRRRKTV